MHKRLIIAVVSTALATLALVGASFAVAAMIDTDISSIESRQRAIDEQYALRTSMRSSAANLAATKARIGALAAEAVHEGGEIDFIRALEASAAAAGVSQDISLETVNQKGLSAWEKEIPLTLRLTGPYPMVIRHLNALERLPYAISVKDVAIDSSDSGDRNGTVRAVVDATVYWLSADTPDFVRGVDDGKASTAQP